MKSIVSLAFLVFFSVSTFSKTKVACIGNSITYGFGIKDKSKTYPAQLDSLLGGDWEVKNFGVSGATLLKKGNKPYWEQNKFSDALSFNPDIAIIKLGTNDSKTINWKENSDDFIFNYYELIDTLRALPSKPKIYLCLPITVVEDKWNISKEIVEGEITEKIKKVANDKKTELIDLYPVLENKPELIPDKIHPNAEGASLIAWEIYKKLTLDK